VRNSTGSEQLAGMKEVADWRCLKLDAKTLPNSKKTKRTQSQNVSTKKYFTSCDPHHDIYTFSYWQIFWHSI